MRVAAYVRVSTSRQTQAQTIEQQLARLRAHIEAQGWDLSAEHIFRDDGYSGATLRRPGLELLRAQVAASAFDRVLVTAPDRLARNYVHQVLLLDELESRGCQVVFLDRPMSEDPHDQLLLQIRGAVAEYERSLITERMRRGRRMKLEAGLLLPWTRPPFGYRMDPDRPRDPAGVRLEPAEAAVVREMFAWYAEECTSIHSLAKRLQERGIRTPRGHTRWNESTLRGILTNPTYTGQVYAGRQRYREARVRRSAVQPIGRPANSHDPVPHEEWIPVAKVPAIVDQEAFDRVQAKLARNRAFAPRNNTVHPYLLRALVSCGACRLACVGRTAHQGRYAYYACRGKGHPLTIGRDARCPARFAPARQLEDLVWADLCEVLTHPEIISQALERAQGGAWLPQEWQARRETIRKGRVSLTQRQERLTEAYLGGVIPLAEYRRRRNDLEERLATLEGQSQQLEAQARHRADIAGLTTAITDFCRRVRQGLAQATFEQKRELLELLIDRVVVYNEDVEIRYVIPTSPSSEHIRFCHLRTDYFQAEWQQPVTDDVLLRGPSMCVCLGQLHGVRLGRCGDHGHERGLRGDFRYGCGDPVVVEPGGAVHVGLVPRALLTLGRTRHPPAQVAHERYPQIEVFTGTVGEGKPVASRRHLARDFALPVPRQRHELSDVLEGVDPLILVAPQHRDDVAALPREPS